MKSGTSFFHKGIAVNLLKRCWPVWSCYLALLLLIAPVSLLSGLRTQYPYMEMPQVLWIRQNLLNSGRAVALLSFGVSIVAVMAMFSFLYNSRTCGMMNALPVRRVTVFLTVWLTGLLPLLAADLLTALITLLAFSGKTDVRTVAEWLAMAAMGNIAFYGFGSFCAMLTGSLFILPLVYAVLNATAFVAESAVQGILNVLLYGGNIAGSRLSWLSPVVFLMRRLQVNTSGSFSETGTYIYDSVELSGLGCLAAYCAAGLLFSFFSLLLYRRRRMETASDTVAIPVLKPVFKYCMAFGTALVFAVSIWSLFFSDTIRGTGSAVLIGTLLLAGAFIGYFAALMLMKKTLKVFRGEWKGFAVVAAVCLLLTLGAECDITGYEKRVPDLSEVESVVLGMRGGTLKDGENLQAVHALHESLIAHKRQNEGVERVQYCTITYAMKDGSTFSRNYRIPFEEADIQDPSSDFRKAWAVADSVEANLSEIVSSVPVTEANLYHASVWNGERNRDEVRHPEIERELFLSPADAVALYQECILPDVRAGRIHNLWLEELLGEDPYSGVEIDMEFHLAGSPEPIWIYSDDVYDSFHISVPETATLTLARLAELSGNR